MLQQLRDKAKSFVSFALLILLVISFGIWGIGDIFRNAGQSDWVAKVGPAKITPVALEREFQKQSGQLRAVLGADFSPARAREAGLLQRSLDQLIASMVIEMEIVRLGFKIGNEPIIATLQETPQLRNADGTFNRDMFQRLISSQGMNEASFLDQQRKIMAHNLFARTLTMPITVPELAADTFAKATAQRRVAEIIRVKTDSLSVPEPDEVALAQFYKENGSAYKTAEKRNFSILRLTPAAAGKDIKISDEDIKAAYETTKDQYEQPEKRDIVQVVFDSEDKAKAFAAVARKESIQTTAKNQKEEAVPLTQLAEKDLPEALAKEVFAKPVSQVGGPVKTNMGWHVFVVEKITPGRKPDKEEVNTAIRTKLQADKAADTLVQTANKIDDMLAGSKSLEDIAKTFDLKIEKTEGVEAGDKNLAPEIAKAGFEENEGETSPLMEMKDKDGGYALVRADKVVASHVEDIANITDKVKADWKLAEKTKKASKILEAAAEQMKKGTALNEVSGEALNKITSQPVRIDEWKQEDVPREVLAPLFNLDKGGTATVTTANGEALVRVKTILPGTEEDIKTHKTAAKEHLSQEWLALHLDELDKALRVEYPVKVDEKAVSRMAAQEN